MGDSIRYKVFFTPRITDDTYGDEIDVSDYIDASGVGSLKRSIDSADYGFGVYTIGDVTQKVKTLMVFLTTKTIADLFFLPVGTLLKLGLSSTKMTF